MADRVYGHDQVIRNLSQYRKELVARIVRAATSTQAKVVNNAKGVLRPGYGYITGNLQRSIGAGQVIIKSKEVKVFVEANAEYASHVEMGTSRSRAKPFLGPALLKNRAFYQKSMKQALKPPPMKK